MRRVILPIVLGLLGFGLFFTSMALAASDQPPAASFAGDSPLFDDPITDTDSITDTGTITGTQTSTHPVASAMANYFAVEYSEIATLHEEGYGFGVISHAYFIANTLGYTSPSVLLDEFASGEGWGVIMMKHNLHPGQAGRGGKNLGTIMSGRGQKTNSLGDAKMPPGQLKKSDDDDGGGRGGRPAIPPGQAKDKGKGKK